MISKCIHPRLVFVGFLSLWSFSSFAQVASLSGDKLEQIEGEGFWLVEVTCIGASQAIDIRQAMNDERWCAEGGLLPCAESKTAMAEQACENIELLRGSQQLTSAPEPSQPQISAEQERRAAELQAAERRAAEQQARQRQAQAAAELQRQELQLQEEALKLQEERALLEREKLDLDQEEIKLEARFQEIERLLEAYN